MDLQLQLVIENWMRSLLNDKETYSIDFIPIIIQYLQDTNDDLLNLSEEPKFHKMLARMGDNFPDMEKLRFSMKLIKISKRRKDQHRMIVITNKAMYYFKPKSLPKCHRRIDLEQIESVSILSEINNMVIVHIPGQYDLRLKCDHKDRHHLLFMLELCYKQYNDKPLKSMKQIRHSLYQSLKTLTSISNTRKKIL